MGFGCMFGGHKWSKVGGANNAGDGKFEQGFVCLKCGKRKGMRY